MGERGMGESGMTTDSFRPGRAKLYSNGGQRNSGQTVSKVVKRWSNDDQRARAGRRDGPLLAGLGDKERNEE